MSFGAELKDFVEGFKTGSDITTKRLDQKAKLAEIEKNRAPTEAEKNAPNAFGGGSGNTAIPESPGDSYDYSDINIESDPDAAKTLGFIRRQEGGNNPYNKLVGGKTADLTNMTIGDVLKYQQNMLAQGHESTALGAYQFINKTLADAVDKTNMPLDAKFDQATQDKLGYYLLQKRGWHDYKSGKLSKDAFMNNLASEWASLPTASGKSAYAGVGSNAATTSRQQFSSALDFGQPVEQKSAAAAAPAPAKQEAAAPVPADKPVAATKVGWNQPQAQPQQPQMSTTIAPPTNQLAMLEPPPEEEEQPVLWGAAGGVIPEPQYFATGGVSNPGNPSNADGSSLDKYSATRGYTQQIEPAKASSFQRRVGQPAAGSTPYEPMKLVNGMTPSQLAYKQAVDKLAASRAAAPAAAQPAAAAPQNFAEKARAFNAQQQAKYSGMYNNPYGNRGGMSMQYMDPATGNISSQFMQGSGQFYSHRAEGGMVYHDFAEGGVIPDGGPQPQAQQAQGNDPYDSEYWAPAQGASPGYAPGGYVDPARGLDVPAPLTPQYNTVIPDPNGDIITPYTDPNAEATPYVPATGTPVPAYVHQPTQDELRRPVTDDSAYAYDNEPIDRRSSRFEGTDPLSAPMTYNTDPGHGHVLATTDPRLVPNQARTVNNPVPAVAATGNTYPSLPHRPYSPTPTRGGPGGGTYTGQAPERGGPGGGTLTGQPASTRPTPPHSSTPDNTKTGSTRGVPTPTPRPAGNHGPTAHKAGDDDKHAAAKGKKPSNYYNDPYEREKERFATRDRAGNLLPAKHYAAGGAIPDRNDPYQNEESNFAQPQPQPQAQAPVPQQIDPQQTGSLPPDSGRPIGQRSDRRPTPRLLSDVSKSLHGGIQFLTQHFGLGQDGAVPTPEGQQGAADGARRFASGEGASTPEEINAVDDKIDPQRKMPEGDRQMTRLANVMQFYLERGRKEEAAAAAAGLMQYGAQRTQQYGSLAAAGYRKYLQTKDPADLQKVTQTLQEAYSMIPNGGDYGVTLNPETHELNVSHTDDEGRVTNTPVSPDQLPDIIKSVQDKSAYWNQIQLLADPEGVHQRDRDTRQTAEDIRKHGVTQADTIASEGRAEGREIAGEGRKTEAQIAQEKRAAVTEAAKDKRELEQKEAEHKQSLVEEQDKEKRANEEAKARTLLAAGIDRAKELAKNDTKTDWGTVNSLQGSLYDAVTNKDDAGISESASRIWDALPNDEKRPKAFTELTGLTYGSDFKYTPAVAKAMTATGDQPPANYAGKQPGDKVAKGKDKQGNPIWVVTRNGQNFAIPPG